MEDGYFDLSVPTDWSSSQIPTDKTSNQSNGFTSRDGVGVFNNLLSTWLQHDTNSMKASLPNSYSQTQYSAAAANTQRQSQNRTLLMFAGIGLIVFLLIEKK